MKKSQKKKTLVFPVFIKSSHGGMQQALYGLVKGLRELGWDIVIILQKTTDLLTLFGDLNVRIIQLDKDVPPCKLINIFKIVTFLSSLYKCLWKFNFKTSIIITNDLGSHILLMFYPNQKNEVYVSRGGKYLFARDSLGKFRGYSVFAYMISFRRVIHFIAVSNSQKDVLIRNAKIKAKYISIIYDSYNSLENISPKEFSVDDCIQISIVGYIDRNKNQEVLIRCLKKMRERGVNCFLNIYGSIKDREYFLELKSLINELGIFDYVFFHGFVDNKETIYNNTHILISSSWSEGFGLTLIEAMSYNIPIIAYSGSGGPGSIIEDNVSGLLVKNNNPKDYELAILKYIEDKAFRDYVVDNGFRKYRYLFSDKTMIDQYAEYLKLV